ncbi:RND family efflux transporter MFP subunit [Granulicella aggregans]|uniref:RND family efflux transporter MFP subunit n=1 Tax=Granulicella aggregans TaxID=474949 RepID=A0A7W7ZDP9_9BACT|nr:efflux RND transporter periplasmic adaptor subunit [Granulicella aggregans]MBB5057897.1 RND family efflux transporter MFP subunit [Granulicella aggregans]
MKTSSIHLRLWLAAAVAIPAILATGCDSHDSVASSPPALKAPAPAPQAIHAIEPAKVPYRTTGPLVAEQQSDVAAQRDGRVVSISVGIGDRVRRGQELAALDDRALRTAVESHTAKLDSLHAQVREWESEEKMDSADLRRADQMRASKILSEEGWEHVKYKLDEVTSEVARYRADEAAAAADLKTAKLQLEQCHILAPFAGVVGRQSLRLAQEVKQGDVLFWITAEAPLRILFTVPESEMASYPTGAPLDLTSPGYPALHQPARVLRVSPVVDPASDSVQVIGALIHPSPLLKPGMSMQINPALSSEGHTAQ